MFPARSVCPHSFKAFDVLSPSRGRRERTRSMGCLSARLRGRHPSDAFPRPASSSKLALGGLVIDVILAGPAFPCSRRPLSPLLLDSGRRGRRFAAREGGWLLPPSSDGFINDDPRPARAIAHSRPEFRSRAPAVCGLALCPIHSVVQ